MGEISVPDCAEQASGGLGSRPASGDQLVRLQEALGQLSPAEWRPEDGPLRLGGCFIAFQRGLSGPGAQGDLAWAAAVIVRDGRLLASTVVEGHAGAAYKPGLLFLRSGPLLIAAVRGLPERPRVLFVNATGLDHPRRSGLALHLGAVLGCPTVGVTNRPLCSEGPWPAETKGSCSPLLAHGEAVGYWVRTLRGVRPVAAHAAWRTNIETAAALVMAASEQARTPEPLRLAREAARAARAAASYEAQIPSAD